MPWMPAALYEQCVQILAALQAGELVRVPVSVKKTESPVVGKAPVKALPVIVVDACRYYARHNEGEYMANVGHATRLWEAGVEEEDIVKAIAAGA